MEGEYYYPSRRWRLILFLQHGAMLAGVAILLLVARDAIASWEQLPSREPELLLKQITYSSPLVYLLAMGFGGLMAVLSSTILYQRISYAPHDAYLTVRVKRMRIHEYTFHDSKVRWVDLRPGIFTPLHGLVTVLITTNDNRHMALPGLRRQEAMRIISKLRGSRMAEPPVQVGEVRPT